MLATLPSKTSRTPDNYQNRFVRMSTADPYKSIWDMPEPPPLTESNQQLEPGEVSVFNEQKGYGFLECADGQLFFHASGFRMPIISLDRMKREVRLDRIRQEASRRIPGQKAPRVILPVIKPRTALMFMKGDSNGRRQASMWCLQDMYQAAIHNATSDYFEEREQWQRLGRYRLVLKTTRDINPRESETKVELLFEGTNVEYMRGLFSEVHQQISMHMKRWIELSFQVYNEPTGSYGDWEDCDQETMLDFFRS